MEEFLSSEADRSSFFMSKAKGINSCLLNSQNRQSDLVLQAADRIYDTRFKIVHTRGNPDKGELELLLPYSKEADRLEHDIDLVRFVAQKVLVASSKQPGIAS